MTLIRWTPFRDMESIQDEMNRLFNSYISQPSDSETQTVQKWNPHVDVSENDHSIQVSAEIPGMKKSDIAISIQDNILTLKGEKKRDAEAESGKFHRSERMYGNFERSFSLPSNIHNDEIKATYKNGILSVLLPKAEDAKPREIDVAVN